MGMAELSRREIPRSDLLRLNLHYLDRAITRMESIVDRAIVLNYPPGSVQLMETARYYGTDDLYSAVEETYQEAESAMAALRADAARGGVELPLDAIVRQAELSEFEADTFLLALVPLLDSSFRKRIALFRDNILLNYTDVDLAMTLLLPDRISRLSARSYFDQHNALVRNKLIDLALPKEAMTSENLLAYELRIPTRVVSYVLGQEALDDAITACARLTHPSTPLTQVVLPPEDMEEFLGLMNHYASHRDHEPQVHMRESLSTGTCLVIQISGPPGSGKSLLVQGVATHLDRKLLTVDCSKLIADDRLFNDRTDKIFFEARQRSAVLCFDGCDVLFGQRNPRAATVYRYLEDYDGIVLMVTSDPQELDFALERWVAYHLKLELPYPALREELWRIHLPTDAPLADNVDIKSLAQQFEFTGGQIRNAVLIALNRAMARGGQIQIDQSLLEKSAHAQLRADMDDLSHKSRITLSLSDLILPADEMKLVVEVLNACKMRNFVMTHWGFGKRLTTGKGLVILFAGEPGTGKTLCAEIIANNMGLSLYRVSIPRIMSKWVGETEKNISKIFSKARASQSMLLFDEADALFTSRVKVESSVDRFANMETNLLLQEIERFEGICILTTNHEKNMDEAFKRRIQFKILFPFPDPKDRARIWRTLIPKECPTEPDIDFELLGKNFELSGGYIKNAIVRAAYRAAVTQHPISMRHIEESAEQECKNAGKIFRSLDEAAHKRLL